MAAEKTYRQLIKEYEDLVSDLNNQKIKAFGQLKTFCYDLHQQIDKMESSLKEEIDVTVLRQQSVIEEQINLVKNKCVNNSEDVNDVAPEDVLRCYLNVNDISLEICLDRGLIKTIGTGGKVQMNIAKGDNSFQVAQQNKDASQSSVAPIDNGSTIFRELNTFKIERDGSKVNTPATGSFLPNGNLLFGVCWPPNGLIVVYNKSGVKLKQMELQSFPHSVAVLQPNMVCVTIQNETAIEFRDSTSLELKHTKNFPGNVSGVSTASGNLVVACAGSGFLIVDREGEVLRTIKASVTDGYLSAINDTIVYVESGVNKLICFNATNGNKIFETEMKFGNIKGVSILRDNSIMVSMFRAGKNNISRISPDGSKEVKHTEFASLSWPSAISYDEQSRKLFIFHGGVRVNIYNERENGQNT